MVPDYVYYEAWIDLFFSALGQAHPAKGSANAIS